VGLGGVLLVYLVLPFVTFLATAGQADFLARLADPGVQVAIRNSVLTATISTVIATVLGVPLALVLARRSFVGKRLVEALVVLPIVLPPVVGGAMLLTAFGRFTPIGSAATAAGVPLTNSLSGIVLAQTFVAAPFVVITARSGFASIDRHLEEASRSLGYGPFATFRKVSLPLAGGAIIAGVTLTFARAIGEFGATMMVAYNPRTMPTRIWVDFIAGGVDAIVPVALSLLGITLLVLAALHRIAGLPESIER
jgi:molybdate/tungstate transport system permease protein